ncbi:MAG: LexA family protein [Rickettsiales bacterium]
MAECMRMNEGLVTDIGRNGLISFPISGDVLAGTTGFQSPADDYVEDRIDLAKELITNKANVFCWRVTGQSFSKRNIPHGSIAVIDYALKPQPEDIVMVRLADVNVLKIIVCQGGKRFLAAADETYPLIPIDEDEGIHVYGVLIHCVISKFRG